MQQKQNTNEGVIPTLIAVESTAGAEVDCADRLNQLPRLVKKSDNNKTTPVVDDTAVLVNRREGKWILSQMCQLTWK